MSETCTHPLTIPKNYEETICVSCAATLRDGKPTAYGYECEHGQPCDPGGHTKCTQCPTDPAKVKYKPTKEFHEATMKAMNLHFPGPKVP